jgi:DNA-binding NarL/FixJ family response regulator
MLVTGSGQVPDVIVTDIAMPELNGVDALLALQKAGYSFKVIFLTMLGDTEMAVQALRAGAAGFVLKESAGEELVTAIEEALNGRIYITPRISNSVLQACLHPSDAPLPSRPGMTQRQGEVLRLLAEGRSMKEAAAAFFGACVLGPAGELAADRGAAGDQGHHRFAEAVATMTGRCVGPAIGRRQQ